MTDEELLITDLCARLPYETIVQMQLPLGKINTNLDYNVIYNVENGDLSIKPYLFPMSAMTEEQRNEIKKLLNEDYYINDYGDLAIIYETYYMDLEEMIVYFNWLNAHHFDYRGLIEKGLALDATKFDLNIYENN